MFLILGRALWLSVVSRRSVECSVGAGFSFLLTRDKLAKLRLKAVRRGCWFRDLKRGERRLLDLAIRVVERTRDARYLWVFFGGWFSGLGRVGLV
jgi:hypothetical protein